MCGKSRERREHEGVVGECDGTMTGTFAESQLQSLLFNPGELRCCQTLWVPPQMPTIYRL